MNAMKDSTPKDQGHYAEKTAPLIPAVHPLSTHSFKTDAYWALGDTLLEECGLGPIWDVEFGESFKGGSRLREAWDWLVENGMEEYSVLGLPDFRETARTFPPLTRQMNITWCAHLEAMTMGEGPEEMARLSESLKPGEVAGVVDT